MEKTIKHIVSVCIIWLVSGCVTQNYESDKSTPVVQNESTSNEIAITRISLGLGYLKMGNTAQAKLNLEKAKRFAPNLVQVYTAFAHYYDTVGEPALAVTSYEKALSLDSSDADTLNNYGVFLCKQKHYQEAETQILRAIKVPSYILVAQSYENLALCQLQANDFIKAELYFDKAILHSPNRASSLLQMMRLQYAKGDYKKALVYLSQYEKASRRFAPNALALAFKIYEKQHNTKIAKNYGSMLIKMFPNSYEAKQYLLNNLQVIEADELAKKYQSSILSPAITNPRKRIVKLSPKKSSTVRESINKNDVEKAPLVIQQESSVIASRPTVKKVNNLTDAKSRSNKSKEQSTTKVAQGHSVTEKTTEALLPKVNNDAIKKTKTSRVDSSKEEQKTLTLPIHIVARGDSLFSISKKYNIHMKAIERWNGLSRTKVLKIGDVIYLANPKILAKS